MIDVRHDRDTLRGNAGKKCEDQGKHHKVSKGRTEIEQADGGGQNRQGDAFFIAVHAGRDKGPGLIENVGNRHQQRGEQGQLEGRQKWRGHLRGDHAGVLRQQIAQRLRDERVDVVGEREQRDKHDKHRQDGAQQACAQLGQMRDQGQGRVLRRISHDWAFLPAARLPADRQGRAHPGPGRCAPLDAGPAFRV